MWQKISSTANPLLPPDTQIYKWKYGTITISNNYQPPFQQLLSSSSQSQQSPRSILITTDPFIKPLLKTLPQQTHSHIISLPSSSLSQQSLSLSHQSHYSSQSHKSLQSLQSLCHTFFHKNITKSSKIYILGGGMLLDLCGFAAAIYMRGVNNVIYIPSTLLAVVDATVGGKTGVNFGGVKNLLGVVKHPSQILVSLAYLGSLRQREFANGIAEVVKMAVTHSEELFNILADKKTTVKSLRQSITNSRLENNNLLRQIIKKSLQIKTKVVQNDQFDKNQRNWLNFGHTVGHAIQMISESTSSDKNNQLTHGQCVAIGMLIQIQLGEQIGAITDRNIYKNVKKVLEKFNLPVKIPKNTNINRLIELMTKDKKNPSTDKIQLTLIDKIGHRKQKMTSITIKDILQYFTKQTSISLQKQSLSNIKKQIQKTNKNWQKYNKFPSSKSLSIRYLYLAALSFIKNNKSVLIQNYLESEDTKFMIQCLESLGFVIQVLENNCVKICGFQQKKQGKLNVGNSGLTARFILPLCAHLKGTWHISCHQRMTQRPNQQIFKFCKQNYNCTFKFKTQKQNSFPVTIKSQGKLKNNQNQQINITIQSQQSSQYISSVLLNSYLWDFQNKDKQIIVNIPNGKIVSQSYVMMTLGCLEKFGVKAQLHKNSIQNQKNGQNGNFIKLQKLQNYSPPSSIVIEQDLSSFSYPYALSLIHNVTLPKLPLNSTQGDTKFYKFCQSLFNYPLFFSQSLQFSDCTDTFMTMAAILSTNINNRFNIISHKSNNKNENNNKIKIYGIANQRIKQSNRIQLMRINLQKIGINIKQIQDGIIMDTSIDKYKQFNKGEIIVFQTGGDHRIAMSMALVVSFLLTRSQIRQKQVVFVIDDKYAVNKTFPQFWNYMKQAGFKLEYVQNLSQKIAKQTSNIKQNKQQIYLTQPQYQNLTRTVLLGNRGCGKSTISRLLSSSSSSSHTSTSYLSNNNNNQKITVIDLDDQLTKQIIQQNQYKTISQYVQNKGWQQFRKLQYKILDKFIYSKHLEQNIIKNDKEQRQIVIATGGGLVDWPQSTKLLKQKKSKNITKVYIQKQFKDLIVVLNDKRPYIPNFQQLCIKRSSTYRQIADVILTIPPIKQKNNRNQYDYNKINQFVINQFKLLKKNRNNQRKDNNGGFIYCVPQIYQPNISNNNNQRQIMNWNQNDQQFYVKKFEINGKQQSPHQKQQNIVGIQLRIDSLITQQLKLKQNQLLNLFNNSSINDTELQNKLHYLCRKSIAQFKITNHSIIKDLFIILTLRSQKQFGLFPFTSQNNDLSRIIKGNQYVNDYWRWVRHLHKIPSTYIDVQYSKLATRSDNIDHPLSPQSYIYSYHGSDRQVIQQFLKKSSSLKHSSPFQFPHSNYFSLSSSKQSHSFNHLNNNLIKLCYNKDDQIWRQNHKNWKQFSDICINLKNPLSRLDNKYKMIRRQKDISGIIKIPSKREIMMIKAVSKFFK